MKRTGLLLICFFIFQATGFSQFFEIGGFMGVSNYAGDLTPNAYVSKEYNMAMGLVARYNMMHNLSFKASFIKGAISGTDEHSTVYSGRRIRNLSFQSDIYELSLQAEFNIIGYDVLENITQLSPYLLAGISTFYFNPRAYYDNRWHELQPLGTEGQGLDGYGKKYSRVQIAIPMGIGMKVSITEKANLAFEAGFRKTFTDYLDDVSTAYPNPDDLAEVSNLTAKLSYRMDEYDPTLNIDPTNGTRGNPDHKDWYMFTGMTFTFNLGMNSVGTRPIPRGRPIF
ncbi:MAG: DUF6089 family protein [Bacteroidota bacterium]